jgi:hypothetical protein
MNFFRKTGYVIKHAPFLTCVTVTSIVLTCVTVIQVGPENIMKVRKTVPIFGLLLDLDYPDIETDNIEFAGETDDGTDYYDPEADDYTDTTDTDIADTASDQSDAGTATDTPEDNATEPASEDGNDNPDATDGTKEDKKPSDKDDKEKDDGLVRDGVTVYETYKPRKAKSDCYVDTGLIPLTTEYEYFTAEDYSYFDDALFIGDSRTVGLQYYSDIPDHADFVCQTGLSINKALTTECAKDHKTGKTTTGEKLLKKNKYGKIYLCIGINDIGTGNTDYIAGIYKKLLETIQSYQPDAIVFLQSIMPVTKTKSKSDKIINNENINAKNAAIAKFADGEKVFYLNINEFFTDRSYTAHSGALLSEQSTDGVHIQAVYYRQWADLLLNYGISTEDE